MTDLKNPKKADLNKDGKLSDYEKKRGAAIEKSMSKYSKTEIAQAVKEVLMEGATCCGRCGRVHKLKKDGGLGCKKPYLSKNSPDHCMNK